MNPANKKSILTLYKSIGNNKLYKVLISTGIYEIANGSIDIDDKYLDFYKSHLALYRRGEDEDNLSISKIYRRAAHKLNRILIKIGKKPKSAKFLRLVG